MDSHSGAGLQSVNQQGSDGDGRGEIYISEQKEPLSTESRLGSDIRCPWRDVPDPSRRASFSGRGGPPAAGVWMSDMFISPDFGA